jgi:hypothetical protein
MTPPDWLSILIGPILASQIPTLVFVPAHRVRKAGAEGVQTAGSRFMPRDSITRTR